MLKARTNPAALFFVFSIATLSACSVPQAQEKEPAPAPIVETTLWEEPENQLQESDDIKEEPENKEPEKVQLARGNTLDAPSIPDLLSGKQAPPTLEESNKSLGGFADRWFYGHGIGQTILNIGTIVIFPPYAVYLVGNAGLSLAGMEQVRASNALPEKPREYVLGVYDGLTSVPGRIAAGVAGKPFNEK